MVSVCAPVAASRATRSPGLAPRCLHFRKQHRRDRGHVGGLGARNARHQIHRADQHIMQAAADMAEQARQERHHGARHAGHLDQQAEEHEQRHRQQDEVAHALVHAADQHHQRRVRRQRQIAVGRKPKPERDRHAGEHAKAGDADEEDDQVEIAERLQRALQQPEHRDHSRDRQDAAEHGADIAGTRQPQERKQPHQADADRQRRRAPAIGDLQRRRGDKAFLVGVFVGRPDDHQQERQRGAGRDQIEIGAHRGPGAGDDGGHPHVLGAAERHRRTQHGEPQEQDRGQFVRPDQRTVQPVARHHASEQDDDLGEDEQRRRNLDQRAKEDIQSKPKAIGGEGAEPPRRSRFRSVRHEP